MCLESGISCSRTFPSYSTTLWPPSRFSIVSILKGTICAIHETSSAHNSAQQGRVCDLAGRPSPQHSRDSTGSERDSIQRDCIQPEEFRVEQGSGHCEQRVQH